MSDLAKEWASRAEDEFNAIEYSIAGARVHKGVFKIGLKALISIAISLTDIHHELYEMNWKDQP